MAESASASRDLPPPVAEMRDRLLAAVASGDIEDLNEPLAWNELPIVFGSAEDGDDPIAHWQRISADGKGIQVLEDMGRALALPPARLAIGRDVENAGVYVWPYLSERALDRLTVEEEKDLRTLMTETEAKKMREGGTWTWWRLVIGADGTWHAFQKGE